MNRAIIDACLGFYREELPNVLFYQYRWEALSYANCEAEEARGFVEVMKTEPEDAPLGLYRRTYIMTVTLLAPTPDETAIHKVEDAIQVLITSESRGRLKQTLKEAGIDLVDIAEMEWIMAQNYGLDRPALGGRSFTGGFRIEGVTEKLKRKGFTLPKAKP